MSIPVASGVPLEEVPAQLSASSQVCTLTTQDLVQGRVTVIDHTLSAGYDPFVNRCFELTEAGEALCLTTAIRVHEEIQVHSIRRVRCQLVSATLRRELADVIETNEPDATP